MVWLARAWVPLALGFCLGMVLPGVGVTAVRPIGYALLAVGFALLGMAIVRVSFALRSRYLFQRGRL